MTKPHLPPSKVLEAQGPAIGLTPSAVQGEYADYVYDGIQLANEAGSGQLFAQAATGTGKTIGYLTALGLDCARNGRRGLVSTYTRALLRQIIRKADGTAALDPACDAAKALEIVRRETGKPIKVAVLVGRSNFVDTEKAVEHCAAVLERQGSTLSKDEVSALAALIAWAQKNPGEEIRDFIEGYGLEQLPAGVVNEDIGIDAKTDPKSPSRVAYEERCEEARNADILIVTHALLLVDRMYRDGKLLHAEDDERVIGTLIIDEADKLEDAARSLQSDLLALAPLQSAIENCVRHEVPGMKEEELRKAGEQVGQMLEMLADLGKAHEVEMRRRREFVLFFEDLAPAGREVLKTFVGKLSATLEGLLRSASKQDCEDSESELALEELVDACRKLAHFKDVIVEHEGTVGRYADQVLALRFSPTVRHPAIKTFTLNPARVLGRAWKEWLYSASNGKYKENEASSRARALVLTSATLSAPSRTGVPDFFDIAKAYGIYDRSASSKGGNPLKALNAERREFSPTKFGSCRIVFSDSVAPPVYLRGEEEDEEPVINPDWVAYAVRGVRAAHAQGGRTLVLCNSYRTTRILAEEARDQGIPVIEMRPGLPQESCIASLVEDPNGIFITPSAWEGFDINQRKGPDGERLTNAIRHVVLTQLPLTPPDGPFQLALVRYLQRKGITYLEACRIAYGQSVRKALVKTLQAFGRGIRDKGDSFTFWITDPRFPRSDALEEVLRLPAAPQRHEFKFAIPRRFRVSAEGRSPWETGKVLTVDGRVLEEKDLVRKTASTPLRGRLPRTQPRAGDQRPR